LVQVSENHNLDTFAKASGHPYWDTTMNEEYFSIMANDTWDLVPLSKEKLSYVNGCTKLSMHQMEVFKDIILGQFPNGSLKLKEFPIMKHFPL
jgi:hypothetical protein